MTPRQIFGWFCNALFAFMVIAILPALFFSFALAGVPAFNLQQLIKFLVLLFGFHMLSLSIVVVLGSISWLILGLTKTFSLRNSCLMGGVAPTTAFTMFAGFSGAFSSPLVYVLMFYGVFSGYLFWTIWHFGLRLSAREAAKAKVKTSL